jgi:cytochrome c oxidase subunit IV
MNLVTLIVSAVAWLVVAAVLVLDLGGWRRRDRGFRWLMSAVLLMVSAGLLSQVANDRDWARSSQLAADVVAVVVCVPALACLVTGAAMHSRLRKPASGSAPTMPPDGGGH